MAVELTSPPIFRLPADILAELMDSCTPLSFFNLATTCKHLATLSEPVLSRNREAHRRFRYASDLDPTCMPALVRSVVLHHDPVVAHFARSIDIWGTRLSWDEWRRYEVDERGVHMRGDVVDSQRFDTHEVRRLLALTNELLGEDELHAAEEELKNGADGLLNFLVIASCPRLEALKFIRRDDVLHKSCQNWLEKSIRHISSREAEWPAGLQSIRDAAFGVDAGILDEHIQVIDPELRPDRDGAHSLAAFMRLPSIEALYYRTELLLGDEEAEDQEPDYDPEFLIDSNVKYLFIDNISGTAAMTLESLYGAPVALETLAMRFSLDQSLNNVDESLELLAESQAKSLKQLMFYNPGGICGYRTDAYRPENIQQFQGLKLWYQSIQDVELQALYDNDGESPSREDVMDAWTKYMLPETEVLILDTTNDPGVILAQADRRQAWDFHDEALAAVIREFAYPKRSLKALFVPSPKDPDWGHGKQGANSCPIPKTVKMGQDLGVDVYIAGQSTGRSPKRHVIDFPMAVTKWDIPSGPSYGKRIVDGFVAFEAVSGRWMKQPEEDMGYYMDAAVRP
ncbi:hypothetical protein LIA77_08217 [Sarocladium implicatum]|nr:hypothetical protein LIA77_08217 [Sarocladium implicatum]